MALCTGNFTLRKELIQCMVSIHYRLGGPHVGVNAMEKGKLVAYTYRESNLCR
jgi:hypothetical protein